MNSRGTRMQKEEKKGEEERERKNEGIKQGKKGGNACSWIRGAGLWKTLPTLRPAVGLKERNRGKKGEKREKEGKAHLLAVLHLLTYDYIDICSGNRFPGQISIQPARSLPATIHFQLICDRESFHVIRHRIARLSRREQREYQTSWSLVKLRWVEWRSASARDSTSNRLTLAVLGSFETKRKFDSESRFLRVLLN